ncbi:cholesterol side-chain cleavage enzyme, mitochondrial-like [Lampetra planeri]
MEYRKHRRRSLGVLLQSGDEWWSRRSSLNRELLAPAAVSRQATPLGGVARDFALRLDALRGAAGGEGHVAGLENELFKFALESVCSALFGERLGLLSPMVPPDSQRFIEAIATMFHSTVPMLVVPVRLHRVLNTKTWRRHCQAWDVIFSYADRWIQKSLLSFRADSSGDGGDGGGSAAPHGSIMANLLKRDTLSLDDLAASVTELMAGGVDTTSITLHWALMELARDPSLQEELRSEVTKAMTPGS